MGVISCGLPEFPGQKINKKIRGHLKSDSRTPRLLHQHVSVGEIEAPRLPIRIPAPPLGGSGAMSRDRVGSHKNFPIVSFLIDKRIPCISTRLDSARINLRRDGNRGVATSTKFVSWKGVRATFALARVVRGQIKYLHSNGRLDREFICICGHRVIGGQRPPKAGIGHRGHLYGKRQIVFKCFSLCADVKREELDTPQGWGLHGDHIKRGFGEVPFDSITNPDAQDESCR